MTPHFVPSDHFLIEFQGVSRLQDTAFLRNAILTAAKAADANILSEHFHEFGGAGGITGVVLLAESHISIHTWPEFSYAAIDIFMCGGAQPNVAAAELERILQPSHIKTTRVVRGPDQLNQASQPSR